MTYLCISLFTFKSSGIYENFNSIDYGQRINGANDEDRFQMLKALTLKPV